MNKKLKPFLNLSIRLGAQAVRLFFLIYIIKILDSDEYAEFGICYALIMFFVLLSGGEFHVFMNRTIARGKTANVISHLKNHCKKILPYLLISLITLSLILLYSNFENISILLILLLIEYVSQELSRLFISLNEQLVSSLILFLRTASWVPVSLFLSLNGLVDDNLLTIYTCWLAGSVSSAIFGGYLLKKKISNTSSKQEIDGSSFANYKQSFQFLTLALITQAIQTFDRMIVNFVAGSDFASAYIFFFTITSAISSVFVPLISNFFQPLLIKIHGSNEYSRQFKKMAFWGSLVIFLVSVSLLASIKEIISLANKGYLLDFLEVFHLILFIAILKQFVAIFHIKALAEHRDWDLKMGVWIPALPLTFLWLISVWTGQVFLVFVAIIIYLLISTLYKSGILND